MLGPKGPAPSRFSRRRLGNRRFGHRRRPVTAYVRWDGLRGGFRRLPPGAGDKVSRACRRPKTATPPPGGRWIMPPPSTVIRPEQTLAGTTTEGTWPRLYLSCPATAAVPPSRASSRYIPVTERNVGTASYRDNATGYWLTQDGVRWFWDQYPVNDAYAANSCAAPAQAGVLSGLPPALQASFALVRQNSSPLSRRSTQLAINKFSGDSWK